MPKEEKTPPSTEPEDRADRADEHTQALAKQPKTFKDLLKSDDFKKAVAEVAPHVMRADRFVRAALTAMIRTPLLAECTRESFFKAMLDCAFYGLEPDGRRAHLIPYKNKKKDPVVYECQLIIDYKGLAELVRRSGDVSMIHADAVYEDDTFEVQYGTGGHLTHKPGAVRTGNPRLFYSYVRLKDGGEDFDVMTLAEVEKIRARSKSPNDGPWVTDFNEMGKKTAFRRHSKWLPLSHESRAYLNRMDAGESEAIDVSSTWSEMIGEGAPAAKRITAADRVQAQAPFLSPAEKGTEEQQ
jgi:recombination protein RecT